MALLVVVAGASSVAAQQRDPFEPLVEPGTGGEEATDQTGTQPVAPQPVQPGVDRLADTGGETEPWLAIAYALAAVGAGAVVLSRTLSPAFSRPARRR